MIIAEIELESENELIQIPEWCTEEVSQNSMYYNAQLIKLNKFRRVGIALLIIFFGFLLYVVLGFLLSLLSAKVFDAHPG